MLKPSEFISRKQIHLFMMKTGVKEWKSSLKKKTVLEISIKDPVICTENLKDPGLLYEDFNTGDADVRDFEKCTFQTFY